jgi:hypothetical protein
MVEVGAEEEKMNNIEQLSYDMDMVPKYDQQ